MFVTQMTQYQFLTAESAFQMPGASTIKGSGVPFQPWFMEHVKTSLVKKDFSSLYFTVGLVEEAAELIEEKEKETPLTESVVSEVGDVCWYIYGLCNSLSDVVPSSEFSSDDLITSGVDEAAKVLTLCGKLCGSVEKWNRGDQGWDKFRGRIQGNVSELLHLLALLSPVPLELAMERNVEKIQSRRDRKVVLGDGSDR